MYTRRKVFVSYHHGGDRGYYEKFVEIFSSSYNVVTDHSVRQEIRSNDAEYVIRRIRETYLTGASVTVVLCGAQTWGRRFVDWEILASLNQGMGLVGINLPSNPRNDSGKYSVPGRLHDNIVSSYASWINWNDIVVNPYVLTQAIDQTLRKSKSLIVNSRDKRLRSA